MKGLAIFTYGQSVSQFGLRVGVVDFKRDTKAKPVRWSKYRLFDREFSRYQFLVTVRGRKSTGKFYTHKMRGVTIPVLGSLLSPLFKG